MAEPERLCHEVAGIVEAAGAGVEGWRAGDAAVLQPSGGCGTCART